MPVYAKPPKGIFMWMRDMADRKKNPVTASMSTTNQKPKKKKKANKFSIGSMMRNIKEREKLLNEIK